MTQGTMRPREEGLQYPSTYLERRTAISPAGDESPERRSTRILGDCYGELMMLDIHTVSDKSVKGQKPPTLRRLQMAGPNMDPLAIPHETLHSVHMTEYSKNLITSTR